jgi:hypothetical protein
LQLSQEWRRPRWRQKKVAFAPTPAAAPRIAAVAHALLLRLVDQQRAVYPLAVQTAAAAWRRRLRRSPRRQHHPRAATQREIPNITAHYFINPSSLK